MACTFWWFPFQIPIHASRRIACLRGWTASGRTETNRNKDEETKKKKQADGNKSEETSNVAASYRATPYQTRPIYLEMGRQQLFPHFRSPPDRATAEADKTKCANAMFSDPFRLKWVAASDRATPPRTCPMSLEISRQTLFPHSASHPASRNRKKASNRAAPPRTRPISLHERPKCDPFLSEWVAGMHRSQKCRFADLKICVPEHVGAALRENRSAIA